MVISGLGTAGLGGSVFVTPVDQGVGLGVGHGQAIEQLLSVGGIEVQFGTFIDDTDRGFAAFQGDGVEGVGIVGP